MGISPVYNKSLLAKIADAKKISYVELEQENVGNSSLTLKRELQVLVDMGFVKEEDEFYIFIHF